jgi:hypothetical protein
VTPGCTATATNTASAPMMPRASINAIGLPGFLIILLIGSNLLMRLYSGNYWRPLKERFRIADAQSIACFCFHLLR